MDGSSENAPEWRRFLNKFLKFYYLHLLLVSIIFCILLFSAALSTPKFYATALLGPPETTPLAFSSGLLGGASIAQQLAGGGGADDSFSTYVQLLQSHQVAQDLVTDYKALPIVFSRSWDADHARWRTLSSVRRFANEIRDLVTHKPIKDHPDVDDMQDFLSRNLSISRITPITSAGLLRTSSIINVSLTFRDRVQALRLLNIILDDADSIVRQDHKRDALARINYLEETLPTIQTTDERSALITALTNQRQNLAAIEADQRYASTLLVPPYASLDPISDSIGLILIEALLASLVLGSALVYFLPEDGVILRWFGSSQPRFWRYFETWYRHGDQE